MIKIKLQTLHDAADCPFYVDGPKKNKFCFVKQNISMAQAVNLVEDNPGFDPSSWNEDCEGDFANCALVKLLYDLTEEAEVEPEQELKSPIEEQIDDYDPYEEYEDEEESEEEPEPEDLVSVRVLGVENVYSVKVDALVYPNNQLLFIDDIELSKRSLGQIQAELDKVSPPVQMGSVYITTNGGEHRGGIIPKKIYHAIVATQMRLVNEQAISKAVVKSLTQADADGVENLAMLPMDCGTFDLYQTASAQLGAIYNFLQTVPTKNLKNIFIITTKNDKVTLDIYNEKFDRIFGE
jgi:hypothetical protein